MFAAAIYLVAGHAAAEGAEEGGVAALVALDLKGMERVVGAPVHAARCPVVLARTDAGGKPLNWKQVLAAWKGDPSCILIPSGNEAPRP